MSTFERDGYEWRETYLLFFDASRRPTLAAAEKLLKRANKQFELVEGMADDDGWLESITVLSPSDFAAVDICYDDGEEIAQQAADTARGFKPANLDEDERVKVQRLAQCNARFDLLHFGKIVEEDLGDDDLLDPSTLLAVMETMIELTDGVGIDPASGTLM